MKACWTVSWMSARARARRRGNLLGYAGYLHLPEGRRDHLLPEGRRDHITPAETLHLHSLD